MLQEIVDSKNDAEVLSFLLAAPVRSFSVIEVSKRLKMPYMKAAHSLNKLVAADLLKSFSKKGKKYYLLNERHKLLPEIKDSLYKSGLKYQDELFNAVKKVGDIKAAFLSGLFSGQPDLPVDLLLVGRVNLNKLSEFLRAVEKLMGQEINYSIMSVEEFVLRRDTFDKFIKDIFDYPHLVVADDLKSRKKGKK